MKNKKILNICLLTFGLITLITFILPFEKFRVLTENSTFVTVMFYILNGIMIMVLALLIILSIINLFKDDYSSVKLLEIFALIGIIMVFITLIIFGSIKGAFISVGYIVVALEMFVCANFSQMARLFSSGDNIKQSVKGIFNKTETKFLEGNNANVDVNKKTNNSNVTHTKESENKQN